MAQRNPMNERYQGDGPQGQTRKSASKLKPKTEAASSVHIEKKPQTKQERKAARKKRDKQMAAKEAERKRKREEREKQERIAAGEEVEEPKALSTGDKVKKFFAPAEPAKTEKPKKEPIVQKRVVPDTPEYRRLKAIYWFLMGVGVASIVTFFVLDFTGSPLMNTTLMIVLMAIAYIAVISAIILDFAKIRKMQRGLTDSGGRKSPKQLKHEQQRAEAAKLMEESKKAQRELKRANSKVPFMRKSTESDAAKDSDADAGSADAEETAGKSTEEPKTTASKKS